MIVRGLGDDVCCEAIYTGMGEGRKEAKRFLRNAKLLFFLLCPLEDGQRMCFGVEDPFIEWEVVFVVE